MTAFESHDGSRRCSARSGTALCALGLALGLAGCTDHKNSPTPDAGGDDVEPTNSAVLYAERIFSPDGSRLYYLTALPGVPTAKVDRATELEFSSADPEIYNHRIYVRDRDKNTITKFKVTADLKLAQDGPQLSVAGTGVGNDRYANAYISPERAYLMDSGNWRLIEWNPTTMTLTGNQISIESMNKQDLFAEFSPAVQVGNLVTSAIAWEDTDVNVMKVYAGSGLMVFDPAKTDPPVLIEDPRVGGAYRVTAAANGDAFMTGITSGAIELKGPSAVVGGGAMPGSGVLRLPAGSTAFDPNGFVDVQAITGSPAVGAIHRISDTHLLAQVYDPALPAPTVASDLKAAQYIYVLIDTVARTFAPVDNLARAVVGNSGNHVVDGTLYIQTSVITRTSYETDIFSTQEAGVTTAFHISGGDLWHLERVR